MQSAESMEHDITCASTHCESKVKAFQLAAIGIRRLGSVACDRGWQRPFPLPRQGALPSRRHGRKALFTWFGLTVRR